jgi:hypothetical protein
MGEEGNLYIMGQATGIYLFIIFEEGVGFYILIILTYYVTMVT